MGDENPICNLGDYSKPSHEGYMNTIELPVGNNVIPLRPDTIRLVQNGCSFYRLWFEDPYKHLKDFLKLVDSLDLDDANRERTRLQQILLIVYPLRHFKTLSLDELRSPDFNLLSDQEYSEEEVTETMAETMEQYMSKTRADYGSGVELRTNTFSGSDHEDANEHIEKVLEIVDLFHIPNITVDQVMLRAFLSKYCPPAHTAKKMEEINNFQQEPNENLYQAWKRFKELLMKCPQRCLTEMQKVVLFYNGLDVPTRQILDSRGAIPSKTAADAKTAI
ncbi:putative reverse transcriptase domain-containing protein [Tanacetum coccineum]